MMLYIWPLMHLEHWLPSSRVLFMGTPDCKTWSAGEMSTAGDFFQSSMSFPTLRLQSRSSRLLNVAFFTREEVTG